MSLFCIWYKPFFLNMINMIYKLNSECYQYCQYIGIEKVYIKSLLQYIGKSILLPSSMKT